MNDKELMRTSLKNYPEDTDKIMLKDYLFNIQVLLGLYKKNKDISLINMILFLTDYFFYNLKTKNNQKIEIILENKSFVTDNIKKFITYNLNQTSLINAISRKLGYE